MKKILLIIGFLAIVVLVAYITTFIHLAIIAYSCNIVADCIAVLICYNQWKTTPAFEKQSTIFKTWRTLELERWNDKEMFLWEDIDELSQKIKSGKIEKIDLPLILTKDKMPSLFGLGKLSEIRKQFIYDNSLHVALANMEYLASCTNEDSVLVVLIGTLNEFKKVNTLNTNFAHLFKTIETYAPVLNGMEAMA